MAVDHVCDFSRVLEMGNQALRSKFMMLFRRFPFLNTGVFLVDPFSLFLDSLVLLIQ